MHKYENRVRKQNMFNVKLEKQIMVFVNDTKLKGKFSLKWTENYSQNFGKLISEAVTIPIMLYTTASVQFTKKG